LKIFISWSGDTSKRLAEEIRNWLPTVLQTAIPYFTPSDIEKGNRWASSIAKELDEAVIGIFCITKDNLNSPWLLFEAGAISKKLEQSLVCPILFGLNTTDITGPLSQFQITQFGKYEIKSLIKSINTVNPTIVLKDSVLNEVFESRWPKLEEKIKTIYDEQKIIPTEQIRSDRNMMEEILNLTRIISKSSKSNITPSSLKDEFNHLVGVFLDNFEHVFHSDWEHSKSCLDNDWIHHFIPDSGTFLKPGIDDESNNWFSRGSLLESYRNLINFIKTYKIELNKHEW